MENKIQREKRTLTLMVALYCKHHHHREKDKCPSCEALAKYAITRTETCKFGNKKPVCSDCPVHCYKREMREKIQKVMRYAGPRMILYHPWFALMHMLDKNSNKRLNSKTKPLEIR